MIMKIVTSVLAVLLVAMVGAGAVFYLKEYKPLKADYDRMKTFLPAYEKTNAELKLLKEKASKETAWLNPAIDALSTGLGNEIKAGTAEVLSAGDKIVVNISEQALYLPGSYTFSKESPQLRSNLVALLKSDRLKGKDIYIGNTTHAVPAQGRGRKKVPAKDARTLAAERSAALIRDFEKNGVNQDALIASAYPSKQPATGLLIKDRKTVIIIENPTTVALAATRPEAARQSPAKPAPDTKNTVTAPAPRAASQTQPRPIPILPAGQKAQ
ncbi:MAG: hypothetical protein M0R70_07935 [Nitrospirae bacterium]|nr:hypothetical protein [Nitrospirota bacterium]